MTQNHLDTASEAIRTFLHEKPYNDEPQGIYYDLGTVREILARLTYVVERISNAAGEATRHDSPADPNLDPLGVYAAADEVQRIRVGATLAIERINLAEQLLADLHSSAGHLIFGAHVK